MTRKSKKIKTLINKKRKRLLPFLIGPVFVLGIAFFVMSRNTETAQAWFNDNWQYRVRITFGNSGAATTDEKVKFDIDTSTPIGASKMQSDCADVRFTNASGKVLPHFLDTSGGACNTASTDFYVLFENIVAGDNVAYMYYGNPSAVDIGAAANFSQATFAPTSGPSSASEQTGTGPAVYWSFDEGVENTCSGGVNDICNYRNDGVNGKISGASWKDESMCVSGKCLYFDGSNDTVIVTNSSTIDFDAGLASGITYSFWVKAIDAGEDDLGQIFNKGVGNYCRTNNQASGNVDLECEIDLATTNATLSISSGLTLNVWHYVSVTYADDGDDELTIYIDGNNRGTSTNGNGSPAGTDTANLSIGGRNIANFHGFIDEFKIYPYERSETQIKNDYQISSSINGVNVAFGIEDQKSLSDGLVGYWPMDETAANSCTGGTNDSCDYSGNGYDLAWANNTTTATGKYGTATTYDGTDDYAACTDANCGGVGKLDFGANPTVSWGGWVKTSTAATQMIAGKKQSTTTTNAGYLAYVNSSGYASCKIGDTVDDAVINDSVAINDGTWHHVFCVTDGYTLWAYRDGTLISSTDASGSLANSIDNTYDFRTGTTGSDTNDLTGQVDEIRVYNRPLSPGEVEALYNWGPPPVAEFKFDDGGFAIP